MPYNPLPDCRDCGMSATAHDPVTGACPHGAWVWDVLNGLGWAIVIAIVILILLAIGGLYWWHETHCGSILGATVCQ
jgi:hypothetical protein